MNILHIDCSAREASYSRSLSAAIVEQLVDARRGARIVRRDLGRNPIPHADSGYAAALASPQALAGGSCDDALLLSEQLIREIEQADVLVIGTPMNNFTVPSVFKAWIDQVLRMGRTIGKGPGGEKFGLLRDRPVYIGIASGGVFHGDGARQPDFLTPYLSAAFGCVGLRSLQFLPLQATAFLDAEQLAARQESLLATLDRSMLTAPSCLP